MKKKIGIFGIRALPAKYGAFDTFVENFIKKINSEGNKHNFFFYIDANIKFKTQDFHLKNISQIFLFGQNAIFRIFNYLINFLIMYFLGVRVFIFLGYGSAIFFPIFKLLKCKIICNPDGIEWRRPNNYIKRKYFKICEYIFAKVNCYKIYDSEVIKRYYKFKYKAKGQTIYYPSMFENYEFKKIRTNKSLRFYILGRLLMENNISLIVDTFCKLDEKYKLFIIGYNSNYFKKEILFKIKNLRNIFYLGSIYEKKKLYNYLSFFDYYIHGHSVGGTNPTLIEAISLNKKIISYNSSFNKEILGKNALYFKTSNDLKQIIQNNIYLDNKNLFKNEYTQKYIYEKYTSAILKQFNHN
jgi:hypothetical protein